MPAPIRAGRRPWSRRAGGARRSSGRRAAGRSRSIGASGCRSLMSRTAAARRGQVAQAEEVHLQRPAFSMSPISHWVVTTSLSLSLLGIFWSGTSSSSGRSAITTPAAWVPTLRFVPFEPPGEIEQPADLGVFLGQPPQRRLFLERVLERDVQPRGDQLVDLLDPGQRDVQRPADVLDRRLGLHRAEGADLGDVGVAVLLADVLDDLVPPLLAEVDVDVGRLGAVRVEEPLEEQVVLERADVAEMEQIADQGAAGRAAGRGRDALLAGVADEVPDDQEVRGEPHPVDDRPARGRAARATSRAGVVAVAVAQARARRARGGSPRASCSSGGLERGEAALAQAEALVVRLDHLGDPRRGRPGPPRGRASPRTSPPGCGRRTPAVSNFIRVGSSTVLPVLMQSKTSCAAASSRVR